MINWASIVQEWMEQEKIGFAEAATKLGVTHVSVRQWVKGETIPGRRSRRKINRLTGRAEALADRVDTIESRISKLEEKSNAR